MGVSESECNIVNETLSQTNSSDVPTNVMTELKYYEHIEPSVSVKGASYFNIFECSRNLLDQLDVTYQRAFTASEATSLIFDRWNCLIRPRLYHKRPMTEPYLLRSICARRARYDCSHRISSYTL